MIRGVIFDMDGVLVATDELHYQTWVTLAHQEDIPFDRTINHRMRGLSRMNSLKTLLESADKIYSTAEKISLSEQKNKEFIELVKGLTARDILPGVREIIDELKRMKILTAVASASRNAAIILTQLELINDMDALVDGNDVSRSKPDPEVFLLAAKKLKLGPKECLVVEDGGAGIEAARRAEMNVFGIGPRDRHPDVQYLADSLEGLCAADLIRGFDINSV